MSRDTCARCPGTSQWWTQGDTIRTPWGICKRFSATLNCSVARQPFTRPTQRDEARGTPFCSRVSSAVQRRSSGGIPAATLLSERSSFSPAIRRLRERWPARDSDDVASRSRRLKLRSGFLNRGPQVRFLPRAPSHTVVQKSVRGRPAGSVHGASPLQATVGDQTGGVGLGRRATQRNLGLRDARFLMTAAPVGR